MKETLLEAMHSSGKILMRYFNKPLIESVKESQSSIVTEADFASDSNITSLIRKNFPGHNMVSEETGFTDNGSEFTWIIDPLDGTSNFAAGIPWFGALITILRGNKPFMAGAYLPVNDTVYFAEKGKGVFRDDVLLKRIESRDIKKCLFSFCVDYTDDLQALAKSLDIYKYLVFNSRNIRSTNCLLDFLYVADGKLGGVINMFTRIWDIAGLSLIIQEAGGIMLDAEGAPLQFELGPDAANRNYPVAAGNRQVMETLNNEILGKRI